MPNNNPQPAADSAPWRRYVWPTIVVSLLLGHVLLVTVSLAIAAAMIPGAVTAPAGYEEALAWDDRQEARRASDALGWTLLVAPTDRVEVNGDRQVQFILRDAEGLPIDGATLDVTMFHYAKPADRIERRTPPQTVRGVYEMVLPIRREGQWRISATATRGEDRFLLDTDVWVGRPGGPAS